MSCEKLLAYLMGPTCEVYSLKEISVLRNLEQFRNVQGLPRVWS